MNMHIFYEYIWKRVYSLLLTCYCRSRIAVGTVLQTVPQHVSYEFIWIRRTCDYI